MGVILFLLLVSSLLRGKASSQTCSDATVGIPEYKPISETDIPGTVIFNVSKSPLFNISYSINNIYQSVLQTYFRDFQNDLLFILYLNKSLDLEELYSILGLQLERIEFSFCGKNPKKNYVIINSENEFDPYINISGNLNIPENTPVDTVVYNLLERTSDKDRPVSRTFYYALVNNRDSHFRIDRASSGEIRLNSALDYDSGQRTYLLNISVTDAADSTARTVHALLRVNILDVDDQGPQFVFPGCSKPCLEPEYTAFTDFSYTGPLNVEPVSIKASDPDTLNSKIVYSFYNVTTGDFSNIASSGCFGIDRYNGTIFQLKPALHTLWRTQRLVFSAAEVGSSQPPAFAVITIAVFQRDTALDKSELPGNSKLEDVQSLKSAVIAVSAFLGITILASAIIIITLCHRYRKLALQEYGRSRPGIQEEHPYLSIDPSQIKA